MSKKQEIENVAMKLFSEKGVKATTIKDIAKASMITEGAIYRHFSSKEELANKIFEDNYNNIIDDLKGMSDNYDNLNDMVSAMVGYYCMKFDEEPEIFTYLLISNHNQFDLSPRITLMQFLIDVLKKYKVKGDNTFMANVLLSMVIETGRNILHGHIEGKMSDYKSKLISSCLVMLNNSEKLN